MTVFIAHAPADRAVAESLEKAIERRGQFAQLDDGQTAMHPVQASDVMVALISKELLFAPTRLRLEQRALDAWAEGRLLVVKIDRGLAPVGLRDLPAIDASFEAQREFKWLEVANAVRELLRAPARPNAGEGAPPIPRAAPAKKPGLLSALFLLLVAAPGIAALGVAASIWLANRIGPSPGSFDDLRAGVEAFGQRYGAPAGATEWAFAGAIALALIVLAWVASRAVLGVRRRPPVREPAPTSATAAPPPQADAVFVSYARVNKALVFPVIEAAQREGRKFWLDQQGIAAGDGWAGEIVRAIKSAAGVMVMCSKAAFESDHVKREIYLADRYRKRLFPVFVESAEPPEDFEYFFAGVQPLKLFETPETERSQAIARVLGAAA
ncbi:MAG: toll/interleukin-1 receptor domain-containing protein [Terricaulis sp.]